MSTNQPPVRAPKIPPQVGLREIRKARGLTIPELVERIVEQGGKTSADHISNCEIGWKRPSMPLLQAWAKALGLNPLDVRLFADEQLESVA